MTTSMMTSSRAMPLDTWRRMPARLVHTWQPSGSVWLHPRRRRSPRWRLIGACFSLDESRGRKGWLRRRQHGASRHPLPTPADSAGIARVAAYRPDKGGTDRVWEAFPSSPLVPLAARHLWRASPPKPGELQVRVPLSRRLRRVASFHLARSSPSTSSTLSPSNTRALASFSFLFPPSSLYFFYLFLRHAPFLFMNSLPREWRGARANACTDWERETRSRPNIFAHRSGKFAKFDFRLREIIGGDKRRWGANCCVYNVSGIAWRELFHLYLAMFNYFIKSINKWIINLFHHSPSLICICLV